MLCTTTTSRMKASAPHRDAFTCAQYSRPAYRQRGLLFGPTFVPPSTHLLIVVRHSCRWVGGIQVRRRESCVSVRIRI